MLYFANFFVTLHPKNTYMLMKKILSTVVFAAVSICALAQGAGSQKTLSFTQGKNIPDAYYFLPAPPTRGDVMWLADSAMYVRGKQLRSTARGAEAVADARGSMNYFFDKIGVIMGKSLSESDYPELAKLVQGTFNEVSTSIRHAKKSFARHRPYQVFSEPTPMPEDESPTDFTSYPSGHTVRAWGLALLMTTIDPAHSTEYMRMGYEQGVSRTIVGFHFESDVQAARLAASATFARLCAEKSFLKQIRKARKELGIVL